MQEALSDRGSIEICPAPKFNAKQRKYRVVGVHTTIEIRLDQGSDGFGPEKAPSLQTLATEHVPNQRLEIRLQPTS
jgi:hypothetical protein